MTFNKQQYMYKELSRAMMHRALWANFVVSIYQDCNINNRLNARGVL